ncbi:hypothetical protein K0U83_16340 [bacterium]|nr:hypothetical protein [bacterium]
MMFKHDPPWLPLHVAEACEPFASARGVSSIARSGRGFLSAYRVVSGEPAMLGFDPHSKKHWTEVRRLSVNRFLSAARKGGEKMWLQRGGTITPSRRHLSLIMWAYTPTPNRLKQWLSWMAHNRS